MANEQNMADEARVIPQGNIPLNAFINLNVNIPAGELRARRLAMLLDAPHEPPLNFHEVQAPAEDLRPRKKRSLYTMTMNSAEDHREVSELIANGMRAVQEAQPINPIEFFVNYLNENLNSKNYPNGRGLPSRWGHY